MSQDERFDIVVIGAGPNGMTTAAYLARCGLSVCVLEERTECGGACETQEPIPGVRIYPHAMLMYASPAPGFEQLELHKYGFRMEWDPNFTDTEKTGALACSDGWRPISMTDRMGWAKLGGLLGQPPFTQELLRAAFWCPPHPPEIEVTDDNTPYMQVYKKYQPDIWTPELRQMTMFDLLDEHCETEQFKTGMAFAAWASGAAGHWEGVAIPAALCVQLLTLPNTGQRSLPRGGLHGYFHAIHRAAVHKGAVVRTSCPVDEILIDDGRAVGVRLRETAAMGGRTIRANKAVVAACDVHQVFLKMVGARHLDPGFMRKVQDISLKNQTLYVSVFHTKRQLRLKPRFDADVRYVGPNRQPGLGIYPCDAREIYYENVADVDGRKGQPTVPPERAMWFQTPPQSFDPTDCQASYPRGYISNAFEMAVTSPDYHREGEDSLDRYKREMDAYMRQAYGQMVDGLDDGNVIHHWSATGRDVEFRNTGLIGGTWCYRTPIDGLYHAHQTSGHPGGLCLMAIPYNLMHILIEDGIAEPGDWWYPSPYYIRQEGKISARRE
jgi:phytoene dehydrogenase-like protein